MTEIVETDGRATGDDRQKVRMTPVHVDAPENVALGADHIPLHGSDGQAPRVAKELGEDTALVWMGLQPQNLDAVGEHAMQYRASASNGPWLLYPSSFPPT